MIYKNIEALIGRTPVINLGHIEKDIAEIYVKLESFNPGGSVKDRPALFMLEDAEKKGVIISWANNS